MHHQHREAFPLVHVAHLKTAAQLQALRLERILLPQTAWNRHGAHHSTPIIRQFNPLPIPSMATLSPDVIAPSSAALAKVIGSAAEPVFPKVW